VSEQKKHAMDVITSIHQRHTCCRGACFVMRVSLQILNMKDYPFCQILTSHTTLRFCVLICIPQQWCPRILMQFTCNKDVQDSNTKVYLTTCTKAFNCPLLLLPFLFNLLPLKASYRRSIQRAIVDTAFSAG